MRGIHKSIGMPLFFFFVFFLGRLMPIAWGIVSVQKLQFKR